MFVLVITNISLFNNFRKMVVIQSILTIKVQTVLQMKDVVKSVQKLPLKMWNNRSLKFPFFKVCVITQTLVLFIGSNAKSEQNLKKKVTHAGNIYVPKGGIIRTSHYTIHMCFKFYKGFMIFHFEQKVAHGYRPFVLKMCQSLIFINNGLIPYQASLYMMCCDHVQDQTSVHNNVMTVIEFCAMAEL